MAKNKRNFPNPLDLKPEQEVVKSFALTMAPAAVKHNMTISGQAALDFGARGTFPVIYGAYPNGDFIVWFLFKGYYTLMALVNQKMKHVATFPVHKMIEFQAMLTTIQASIGK